MVRRDDDVTVFVFNPVLGVLRMHLVVGYYRNRCLLALHFRPVSAGGEPNSETGTRDRRSVERVGASLFEAHHDDEVVTNDDECRHDGVHDARRTQAQSMGATLSCQGPVRIAPTASRQI